MFARQLQVVSALIGANALWVAGPAAASSISLCATLYQNNTAACGAPGTATPLGTPGTYTYSDSALSPDTSTGGIITGSKYPGTYPGASFYDAYLIQISNSQGDSISSTIDLTFPGQSAPTFQISNLEERLYSYSATSNAAPFVGAVAGANDFWTTPVTINGSNQGTVAVLPATHLNAGTYVLEVRGDVSGTLGGAYSGTFQLQQVPLPAGLPLLWSGVAMLAGVVRRQRKAG